jgi:hypothetical protein
MIALSLFSLGVAAIQQNIPPHVGLYQMAGASDTVFCAEVVELHHDNPPLFPKELLAKA